eukprot:Hpha_TRINITY_DN34368_c0_g1::TRINITY_DN34368_c0_g1_i1::g.109578::m.109578/K07542/PIGV; phosphatidylinositol glycan, class V
MLPLALRGAERIVALGVSAEEEPAARYQRALLAGVFLSAVAFGVACAELHTVALNVTVVRGTPAARRTAALACAAFCLCPASVFFSAVYTESLFAALTFSALRLLSEDRPCAALCLLIPAAATRSNGVVSAGFIAHHLLGRSVSGKGLIQGVAAIPVAALVFVPFALWDVVGYDAYCRASPLGLAERLGVEAEPEGELEWCGWVVPSLYRHVQKRYWGVGALGSWELRQLPNWVLATPVLVLTWRVLSAEVLREPGVHRRLGLGVGGGLRAAMCYHLVFLALFAVVFMRIEVSTPFLFSSSPLLHIACGEHLAESPAVEWRSLRLSAKVLLSYFALYWVLGHA